MAETIGVVYSGQFVSQPMAGVSTTLYTVPAGKHAHVTIYNDFLTSIHTKVVINGVGVMSSSKVFRITVGSGTTIGLVGNYGEINGAGTVITAIVRDN